MFHEIYGSYYNAVAKILSEAVRGTLTDRRIHEIVQEKGFAESSISIPSALKNGRWPLLTDDNRTSLRYMPELPLTELQKRWMKAVLQDPRVCLFHPSEKGLEDVKPLFEEDFFVYFDRHLDGDPFEDEAYIRHFRILMQALKEKRKVQIHYRGKRSEREQILVPEKMEYSSKDDKFRLLAHSLRHRSYVIRVRSVMDVSLLEKATDEELNHAEIEKKTVVMALTDERNALERAMLHFSDLEKVTTRMDEDRYRIELSYRKEDETEILIRILSFGPMLEVLAPESFREKIRDRLIKQKNCEFG